MQRRNLLKRAGVLGVIGLAGCSGTQPQSNTTETGMTSTMSGGADTTGASNSSGSMNGTGMGGARNPKAGQTAYESVSVDIAFDSPSSARVNFSLPEPVQCSVAYGTDSTYGTLRADQDMTGPQKNHHVPISTSAGSMYHGRLNLFDNSLNALQTGEFTFTAPESGSTTRSSTQTLTYVKTARAEPHFASRPSLDVSKQSATVTYRTKTAVLAAVQFQQGQMSTTRRDIHAKPHTNHTVSINGLKSGTQTSWAVGLIAPDASLYTTVGMAFQTK